MSDDLVALKEMVEWNPESIPHVKLTTEDRRRFARYALLNAYSAWGMAKQLMKMGTPPQLTERYFDEALRWLETARDVWPLERDGDSINIEQILKGRVP